MNASMGKILHIDLTGGQAHSEPIRTRIRAIPGGFGLGVHYLYKNMPAGCDPLGAG
jgi:aldehyde:ferredoxin oxidoreductase